MLAFYDRLLNQVLPYPWLKLLALTIDINGDDPCHVINDTHQLPDGYEPQKNVRGSHLERNITRPTPS